MKCLITGVSGMDGSYLAEHLVARGHEVHGVVRRHSSHQFPNLAGLLEKDAIMLHEADLTDQNSVDTVLAAVKPDEVYNLGAQSFVGVSYTEPEHTLDVTGLGAVRVFEAVRRHAPSARVYQASSSEMFGNVLSGWPPFERPPRLNEQSPMFPESPYGVAKLAAHNLARIYRNAYGLHISCGILFNHESERRGPQFVTRKITLALARIKAGKQAKLRLGNIRSVRDWGYAPEYVEGMVKMLEHDTPGDWVLATGEGHTVEEFLLRAMDEARIERAAVERIVHLAAGTERVEDHHLVIVEAQQRRPTDIERLVGDPTRAGLELKWGARTKFRELVKLMVMHDLEAVQKGMA